MRHPCTARRILAALLVTLAIGAGACADRALGPERAVAGCYRLVKSQWAGDSSDIGLLPDSLRLLGTVGTSVFEQGATIVRPYPDSTRTNFRWSWWQVVVPDTLRVVFATGFSGARLDLRPDGDGYAGRAIVFVDYQSGPAAAASARLTPFACGS